MRVVRPPARQLAIMAAALLAATLIITVLIVAARPDATAPPSVAPAPGAGVEPLPSGDPTVPPSEPPATGPRPTGATTPERRPARPDRVQGRPVTPPDPLAPRPPGDRPVVVEGLENMPAEPRPDGVPEQVGFFFGGGPQCFDTMPAPPPAIELSDDAIIPSRFLICFFGFDKERSLRITLTPPGGRTITRTLAATGSEEQAHMVAWPRLPSDRAGKHRITARQGRTQVTRIVDVVRPATPRLWIDRPPVFQTRTDVQMYYAGFPPDSMIPFNLYAAGGYRATFRVPADAFGGGHAILRTGDDLPDGCFGVSHPGLGDSTDESRPSTENGFCTSRPG